MCGLKVAHIACHFEGDTSIFDLAKMSRLPALALASLCLTFPSTLVRISKVLPRVSHLESNHCRVRSSARTSASCPASARAHWWAPPLRQTPLPAAPPARPLVESARAATGSPSTPPTASASFTTAAPHSTSTHAPPVSQVNMLSCPNLIHVISLSSSLDTVM